MKTYLLVFDDGNGSGIDLRGFVDSLDATAEMYAFDGHVGFLRSGLSVSELNERFMQFAGSRLFLFAEMGSNYAGRMTGTYWDFIKGKSLTSAA